MRRAATSICFLLARHEPGHVSPIIPGALRLLTDRGLEVEAVYPDEELTDLVRDRPLRDLYVLKSGSEAALSVAGALHAAGAALLNPYPVAAACRDKVVATRALALAGVPVPETWCTAEPSALAPLLNEGPLVVKPHRGHQGQGVRIVHAWEELGQTGRAEPIFAQRYHEPDGADRKIYRIGNEVYGVMRVWPARTYEEKLGEPFAVEGELREIALRSGTAFGIDLYGLDVVVSDGLPYVVDFSSFPGFKGVPQAAVRIADYVETAAARAIEREPAPALP